MLFSVEQSAYRSLPPGGLSSSSPRAARTSEGLPHCHGQECLQEADLRSIASLVSVIIADGRNLRIYRLSSELVAHDLTEAWRRRLRDHALCAPGRVGATRAADRGSSSISGTATTHISQIWCNNCSIRDYFPPYARVRRLLAVLRRRATA